MAELIDNDNNRDEKATGERYCKASVSVDEDSYQQVQRLFNAEKTPCRAAVHPFAIAQLFGLQDCMHVVQIITFAVADDDRNTATRPNDMCRIL